MAYKVRLTTKFKPTQKGSGTVVVEPDDYSKKEIKAIKSKGYRVLAYLSIGTLEKERPFYNTYKKYKAKRLKDWPNEFYMDMTAKPWQDFLIKRAKTLKEKGFDGWWLDNLDVYEYDRRDAVFTACNTVMKAIKAIGGFVMVNGGYKWLKKALKDKITLPIDGYTQEEVFTRITSYSKKGTFKKQTTLQSNAYKSLLKAVRKAGPRTYLLEYTRDAKLKTKIKTWCKKYQMTGYCISGDVNL